jgi:hypothetical protein
MFRETRGHEGHRRPVTYTDIARAIDALGQFTDRSRPKSRLLIHLETELGRIAGMKINKLRRVWRERQGRHTLSV